MDTDLFIWEIEDRAEPEEITQRNTAAHRKKQDSHDPPVAHSHKRNPYPIEKTLSSKWNPGAPLAKHICSLCPFSTADFITHQNRHKGERVKDTSSLFMCGMCSFSTPYALGMFAHIDCHIIKPKETSARFIQDKNSLREMAPPTKQLANETNQNLADQLSRDTFLPNANGSISEFSSKPIAPLLNVYKPLDKINFQKAKLLRKEIMDSASFEQLKSLETTDCGEQSGVMSHEMEAPLDLSIKSRHNVSHTGSHFSERKCDVIPATSANLQQTRSCYLQESTIAGNFECPSPKTRMECSSNNRTNASKMKRDDAAESLKTSPMKPSVKKLKMCEQILNVSSENKQLFADDSPRTPSKLQLFDGETLVEEKMRKAPNELTDYLQLRPVKPVLHVGKGQHALTHSVTDHALQTGSWWSTEQGSGSGR